MNNDQYEFWLTDDAGRRIALLGNIAHLNYTRSIVGYSTIEFGLPYNVYVRSVPAFFQRDWRVDVWRSPGLGISKRREGSFFLRKFQIYDREDDGMRMIRFYGRGPWEILRRWSVVTADESVYQKTDYIDDMMKAIVQEQFLTTLRVVPTATEFTVDGDTSLGPSVTHKFRGRAVLDILRELREMSLSYNRNDPTNRRIFFDVVEGPGLSGGFGYVFRTYADRRGADRTGGVIFSPENGNMKGASYTENYMEETTEAMVGETTVTSPQRYASRWNRILKFSGTTTAAATDTADANKLLGAEAGQVSMNAQFLSTPGGSGLPRCLYGVDWDFGDSVRVQYAGRSIDADINIVYVSVSDSGQEKIMGANVVGAE